MIYSFIVDTPKNTTKESPLITDLAITKGVIHKWQIFFPTGHWGECRLRIDKGSEPIIPVNPEGYLSGDDFTFEGEDFLFINSEPYSLRVRSWNIDVNYNHKTFIHLFIKPLWTFSPLSQQIMDMIEKEEIAKVL